MRCTTALYESGMKKIEIFERNVRERGGNINMKTLFRTTYINLIQRYIKMNITKTESNARDEFRMTPRLQFNFLPGR